MRHRDIALVLGVGVVAFIFLVPLVLSRVTTNTAMPCALEGYPCPLGPTSNQNPSGMTTYHLWTSLSYSEWGVGIVYSPDFGVVWL